MNALTSSHTSQSLVDKVIAISCFVFALCTVWSSTIPQHAGQPPILVTSLLIASVIVLVLVHMIKFLGTKTTVIFFICAAVVEWIFEESNIRLNGFVWGDIRYGDLAIMGPKISSVPVFVPLLMGAILWPTFVAVNIALDGKVMYDPRNESLWKLALRCVLYGFVHSWYMLATDGLSQQWGLYHWVGHSAERVAADMFLGDPQAPVGWLIYVWFTMMIFLRWMLPHFGQQALANAGQHKKSLQDLAPVLFIFGNAIQFAVTAVNLTIVNIVLWTMGFFAIFVFYRYIDIIYPSGGIKH